MGDSVDSIKQLLRSVLLSSKSGVKASRLQGDFQELCGSYIPHTKFGFSSLHDFLVTLDDVVRIGRNSENELTYYAIADNSTKHMQALISKQKSKKQPKKKAPPSFSRHKIPPKPQVKPSFHKTTWNKHPAIAPKKFTPKAKLNKKIDKPPIYTKKNMSHVDGTNSMNKFNSNKFKSEDDGHSAKGNSIASSFKKRSRKGSDFSTPKQDTLKQQDKNIAMNAFDTFQKKSTAKKSSNKSKKEYNKSISSGKKGYGKKENQYEFSKKMPPRFARKLHRSRSMTSNVYENPLQLSPKKSAKESGDYIHANNINEQSRSFKCQLFQEKNNIDKDFQNEHSNLNSVIENLKKLLSIYEGGLHLSGIFNLYKETFGNELNVSVMDDVVSGRIQGCALVEKVNITGDNKCILFPYSEHLISSETPDNCIITAHQALEIGKDYKVTVTYSVKCERIFVQLLSETKLLNNMTAIIKNEYNSLPCTSSIKTGSYVITSDGFRARVLSVNKNQTEIFNIDFGDSTASYWITIDKLRFMTSEIAKYPQFCIICNMHRPAEEISGHWSSESMEEFSKVYAEAPIILKTIAIAIHEIQDPPSQETEHTVIFYKISDQYKFNINARLIEEENAILSEMHNFVDPFKFQPLTYATLPDEDICSLFIFNVSCTTEVEVCIIGKGYSDKLIELEKSMFEFYSDLMQDDNLPPIPPCNCVYAVLSHDSCTRGRLLSVTNDNEGIIYLVDNGETETVLLCNLHVLQEQFIELPMQSIKVSLAGLDHQSIATHCSILQKLNDAVVLKTCTARILGVFKELSAVVSVVELYISDGKFETNLNQICYDLIINENLMPVLPLPGCYSAVSVVHVDVENSLVYVRFAGKGMLELKSCLSNLDSLNSQNISQLQKNVIAYPGKLCLVALPSGLHRARVDKIYLEDFQKVSIYLIDVGTYKDVSRNMLLQLDDELMLSIPPQAVCCKLSGLLSSDMNYQLLKDISSSLTSLPLLLKVEKFSNTTESNNVISLWVNGNSNTQIVFDEHIQTPTTASEISSSYSSKQHSRSNSESSKLDVLNNTFSENSDDSESVELLSPKSQFSNCEDIKNSDVLLSFKSLANFMYVNTKLDEYKLVSTLEENPILVKVVEVVSPDYFQVIKLENLPARVIMTNELSNNYKSTKSLQNPDLLVANGMYALHSASENCWYRVRFLSSIDNNVSVCLIDYGGCRVCDRSRIFELQEPFLSLPDLVFTGRLSGIEPLEHNEDSWPQEVSRRLSSLIKNECFYAHVLKITHTETDSPLQRSIWDLCLCYTSIDNRWVNDVLVDEWNCASYIK